MLTSVHYAVSWCYREGDKAVRRTLNHSTVSPCIEAARIMAGNPYVFDVEVREIDTGEPVSWQPAAIGRVLCAPTGSHEVAA